MNIKILCPCGSKFAFEVEPANGRMPVDINCPTCGANALALANAEIKRQLDAATPAPVPTPAVPAASQPRISVASPAPPQPATRPAIRISRPATAETSPVPPRPAPAQPAAPPTPPAMPAADASQTLCAKHKVEPAVDFCVVCKKPICLKCMEMFGHVCSVYCRQQATLKRIYVPAYAGQKSVVAGKAHTRGKLITAGVAVLVALFLGLWIWYAWFARNPKVVYSIPIPMSDPDADWKKQHAKSDEFYELIAPNQLLAIKDKYLSLTDVTQQRQLWSAPLENPETAAAIKAAREKNERLKKLAPGADDAMDPTGFGDDYLFSDPHVITTPNDIWVYFSDRVQRFDRQTGSPKTVDIKDTIFNISQGENSLVVVSGDTNGPQTVTQITLADGATQSEEINPGSEESDKTNAGPAAKSADDAAVKRAQLAAKLKALILQNGGANDADEEAFPGLFGSGGLGFIPAGPNVVQFQAQLLEQKSIAHEAMKPKAGKSILDSGNVTASQGMDFAQEMMNDSQRERTGGTVTEDVSRYQVTLHRRFAKDIPDWTGEVTGPPEFFALKTVDIVVAGNSLYVFDKQNKKLWDAKLANAAPAGYSFQEHSAPCLETSDSLYFADKGILTRFDLATGNPVWRLNSVGISEIQADRRGKLYIVSTTAGPDAINYSLQINVRNKVHPVILKVDPDTGKVLWRLESVGDHCILSGKFLYATRISQSQAWLKLEEGPDTNYNLYLLNPSTGSEIWNYYQGDKRIIKTEIQKNWILLHLEDKVLVLKFFSL